MTAKAASALKEAIPRLERAYGRFVTPGDPVEAGVMATLAAEAPAFATEEVRDRIRQAFVDWNEARVADPWDVTTAMEAGGDPAARTCARAMIRFLESVHTVLNRCSFDVPAGEAVPDWPAALDKMRGAGPGAKAACLAMLAPADGWHATPEIVKAALKLGIVGKTTSGTKVAAGLADVCPAEDRLRVHYLLARYGGRGKDDPDPLGGTEKAEKAEKKKAAPKAPKPPKKGA